MCHIRMVCKLCGKNFLSHDSMLESHDRHLESHHWNGLRDYRLAIESVDVSTILLRLPVMGCGVVTVVVSLHCQGFAVLWCSRMHVFGLRHPHSQGHDAGLGCLLESCQNWLDWVYGACKL